MLSRTRISRKMDTGRLGQAVSRPGLDPRAWVSLAIALGESHVDTKFGVFVDIQIMPTGEKCTALVPSQYAGKGFGLYAVIHKDDDLVVAIPNGDPNLGVVVLNRLWTAADTPPTEAGADANEVMLVVEKDHNLRLKTTGGGKVEIDSDNTVTFKSPKVRLGDEGATEQVVLGTTFRAQQTAMDNAEQLAFTALATFFAGGFTQFTNLANAAVGPMAALKPGFLALAGLCTAATAPQTAAGTAITTFETFDPVNNYLSQVSNTK